ncbi:MAG: tRNA pseudouridine(55) synthase TruB [Chitinophagaceae bacterium]|nr:tRNA pseudouridine(55) synthase TruB [Rubrivivax sp.]
MTSPRSAFGASPQGDDASGPAQSDPRRLIARVRPLRRALHGVLLLDKPIGWTSNDALQKVKGLLRAEKGGHTGTLDPLATGLLPLCFGAATKFSQVSLDADKRYRASLHLGQRTTTGDREGAVVEERPAPTDAALLQAAVARFQGEIEQQPPMFSALKHRGRALYEYARDGIEVDRATRCVTIHCIDIVGWQSPTLVIDVHCSKGTYIRTLAEGIGETLGCGAHLAALQRTGCGLLTLEGAVTIDALGEMTEPEREALLHPVDSLLAAWPEVRLPDGEAGRFLTGLRRQLPPSSHPADLPAVRVYADHPRAFLGAAHITAGVLIADRLLSPLEVQAQP